MQDTFARATHSAGQARRATIGYLVYKSLTSHSSLAEEDWHMPIESFQYFIILFRVNQVFTFYHFIPALTIITIVKIDIAIMHNYILG